MPSKHHLITMFLSDPDVRVNRRSGHFVIRKNGSIIRKIPIFDIGMVIVRSGVSFSIDAVASIMENEIPMFYLTSAGALMGQIAPTLRHDASLRIAQAELSGNDKVRYFISKKLLESRINNALEVLALYPGSEKVDSGIRELRRTMRALSAARDLEMLRLMSERADRDYYRALSELIPPRYSFKRRCSIFPIRDRVNCLLSFGYALFVQEMRGILAREGLDPYVGFSGEVEAGQPALALELSEPLFPPLMDRLMLDLTRSNKFVKKDFCAEICNDGNIFLGDEAQKKFFVHYESWMTHEVSDNGDEKSGPVRTALRKQVDGFKKALVSEENFQRWYPISLKGKL